MLPVRSTACFKRAARLREHFSDESSIDNRRARYFPPAGKPNRSLPILQGCGQLDYWQSQPNHVEVWLRRTPSRTLSTHHNQIPTCRCRSVGELRSYVLHKIAASMAGTLLPIKILYIGDFDPSGLDIERAARRGETPTEWAARRIKRVGQQTSQDHKDGLRGPSGKVLWLGAGALERQVSGFASA